MPSVFEQPYRIILSMIPLVSSVKNYKEQMKEVLDKTYGIVPKMPEGIEYVRSIRDAADRRVKDLWN